MATRIASLRARATEWAARCAYEALPVVTTKDWHLLAFASKLQYRQTTSAKTLNCADAPHAPKQPPQTA